MPEVRIDIDAQELSVMDGYIQASGSNRTKIIGDLVKKWAADKLHESIIVCRMARINPLAQETDRHADGGTMCASDQTRR
jgi:hypothetical protein